MVRWLSGSVRQIKMEYVAYNYFPNPAQEEYVIIVDAIYSSAINISHLGKNDPPKKWAGNKGKFLDVLCQGADLKNYTFVRDNSNKIEFEIMLRNDPIWEFSTISMSGKNPETVKSLILHLAKNTDSFLCIFGQLGLGKDQNWEILIEHEKCPKSLREKIK